MQNKIFITVVALLGLSFSSCSSVPLQQRTPSSNEKMSADLPLWQKDFASKVKKLSRSIDTYSWAVQSKIDKYASNTHGLEEQGRTLVQSEVSYFESKMSADTTSLFAGPGLYLASDPSSTAYYEGVENWVLLKLPFKVNSSFVDIRDNVDTPFSEAASAELRSLGCVAKNIGEMTRKKDCHDLFVDVSKKMGVGFLAYTYSVHQLKDFPDRSSTCFLLTSMDAVDWKGFHTLKSLISKHDSASFDRALITGAFQLAIQDSRNPENERQALAKLLPWKGVRPPSPETLKAYIREHYFSASDFSEDVEPYTARYFLNRFTEIQNSTRYIKTKAGKSIDPLRFSFLIQKYSPGSDSNAPNANNQQIFSDIKSGELEQRWSEEQNARVLATVSAKSGDPLSIATLQKWILGLSLKSVDPLHSDDLKYLEISFSRLEAMLSGAHTLNQIMYNVFSTLDDLNSYYPFNLGMGTMGQAFIQYIRTRAGLPPLYISHSASRIQDQRYLSDTSDAYQKMQECVTRWKNGDPLELQKSECGLVGE